jgi:glycosyltransferase involved in cell wall biosynthesis
MSRPRVVVLRGHSANPWELRSWELLRDRFDIRVGVTGSNLHDLSGLALDVLRVRSVRDRFPRGRIGDLATLALGDGYRGLASALEGADIVHAAELGVWFVGQPARLKAKLGYRLVTTVWETIPFLDTLRGFRGRADRKDALAQVDLFLAATERARRCLLLEGVEDERIEVLAPGVDLQAFRATATGGSRRLIVSPGRLVWEKGHFDVLRALAVLEKDVRLLIVGAGPERDRLHRYAADLGVGDRVEIRSVPYEAMPAVFADASAVVLASLATPVWEEQFGMVLAEAMAAGAPIVASRSGAIPEVLAGSGAQLFASGDWVELSQLLAAGPLAREARAVYPADLVERYSCAAAAERLAAVYERVLRPE